MRLIEIGKVVSSVGLKGQIKVYHYTDYKERFEEMESVILDNEEYRIAGVRYNKEQPILSLDGIEDRNDADMLRGKKVYIREENLRVLPEDTFYIRDLIGCEVEDEKRGRIGVVVNVIQNVAQDIYEVESDDKKVVMIPAVSEFIKKVDIENRKITVCLIEGFINED